MTIKTLLFDKNILLMCILFAFYTLKVYICTINDTKYFQTDTKK